MRALVVEEFGPLDAHEIRDVPDPRPGPGEAVMETRAMALNLPDILIMEGRYQRRPPRPFIAGFDAAGIIAAVGDGVANLKPGDRVLYVEHTGAFATQVKAEAGFFHRIPDAMPFDEAAAFGVVYATAWTAMLRDGGARAGETALITGAAGGVGLAMTQVARALGMTVIAGASTAEKRAVARANGAHAVVDLAADDLRDALKHAVMAANGGRGVDVAFDMVGGDVFDAALRCLRPGGRLVVVGFAGGRIAQAATNYLLLKNLSLIGSPIAPPQRDWGEQLRAAMAFMLPLYAAGALKPHIGGRFAFDDWRAGFAEIARRRVIGKIVLTPSP